MAGEWQPSISETGWRPQVRRDLRFLLLVRRNQRLHIAFLLIQQASIALLDQFLERDASGNQLLALKSRIGHHPNRFVIKSITAHASAHRLLSKDQIGQIKRRWLLKYSHHDQPAAGPRQFPRKLRRQWLPRTFHHHVESLAVGNLERAFFGILLCRVDNIGSAQPLGNLLTPLMIGAVLGELSGDDDTRLATLRK